MVKSLEIKAVIFDVGGVLHSSENEHIKNDIIKEFDIQENEYNDACRILLPKLRTGKITEKEFWEEFIQYTHTSQLVTDDCLWAREFKKRYKVFYDVLEIVKILKNKGIKVAILSNTIESHAKVNKEMGIYDPFSEIILSYEVGLAKPDPKIYELSLRRIGVLPQESVFIDDRGENIEVARELGMHGIKFRNASQLADVLEKILK